MITFWTKLPVIMPLWQRWLVLSASSGCKKQGYGQIKTTQFFMVCSMKLVKSDPNHNQHSLLYCSNYCLVKLINNISGELKNNRFNFCWYYSSACKFLKGILILHNCCSNIYWKYTHWLCSALVEIYLKMTNLHRLNHEYPILQSYIQRSYGYIQYSNLWAPAYQ